MKKLYEKYKELVNYLIAGVLTTLVSLLVYYGATATFLNAESPVQLQFANVLSWIVSVTFAYAVNRKYVFESEDPDILREGIKFYMARFGTLLMDMAVMAVGVTWLGGNDRYVKLISQVIVIVANYLISKLFVFRNQDNRS